jgi:hypothetical protein
MLDVGFMLVLVSDPEQVGDKVLRKFDFRRTARHYIPEGKLFTFKYYEYMNFINNSLLATY